MAEHLPDPSDKDAVRAWLAAERKGDGRTRIRTPAELQALQLQRLAQKLSVPRAS